MMKINTTVSVYFSQIERIDLSVFIFQDGTTLKEMVSTGTREGGEATNACKYIYIYVCMYRKRGQRGDGSPHRTHDTPTPAACNVRPILRGFRCLAIKRHDVSPPPPRSLLHPVSNDFESTICEFFPFSRCSIPNDVRISLKKKKEKKWNRSD